MGSAILMLSDLPVLADAAIRGLVLLGTAATLMLVLHRASAATRHLVWTVALAGVLVVPALRPVLPHLELPVPAAEVLRSPAPASTAGPELPVSVQPPSMGTSSRVDGGAERSDAQGVASKVASSVHSTGVLRSAGETTPGTAGDRRPIGGAIPPLTVLWLVGAILLLLPLGAGWIELRRLALRSPRLEDPRIRHRATRLALRLEATRGYRLLESPAGSMPMTFGLFRATILLPADAREWSRSRLDAVLLHELAHVARRDTATQLLAELVRAFHWFNPLAWLAARRLRVEREHACDDMALAAGSRPSEYADELLALVRSYRTAPASTAALAMARAGEVASRLRAVLDEGRPRGRVRRAPGLAGTLAGLLVILACTAAVPVPAAPTAAAAPALSAEEVVLEGARPGEERVEGSGIAGIVAFDPVDSPRAAEQAASCIAGSGDWSHIQHQSNNGRRTIRMERRGCDFELRMQGDIDFDAQRMTIRGMAAGARLRLEEDSRGTDHSLDIRVGRDGAPVYAYERDGREREFDVEARAWFASALEALFRSTGFLADERVEALLRTGGVEAVLAELGHLETSHGFAQYTEALLEQARLDEAQLRALVRASSRRVESDHHMSGILEAVATHQPLTGGLLDDYLAATASLDSDHYRSKTLHAPLRSDRLTGAQLQRVLQAAATMDSDHYRSRILIEIADRYALERDFRAAYIESAAAMTSDHYRSEVLSRLLDRRDLSPGDRAGVLIATGMIDSDHYRSRLLAKVSEQGLTDPSLQRAFFEVAAGLESDHYYRESLTALLGQGIEPMLLVKVLDSAAREMESDHYLSELLLTVLSGYTVEGAVREAFMTAMDAIESTHYRGRVADSLLRRGR